MHLNLLITFVTITNYAKVITYSQVASGIQRQLTTKVCLKLPAAEAITATEEQKYTY
jgi:hypothetical protein